MTVLHAIFKREKKREGQGEWQYNTQHGKVLNLIINDTEFRVFKNVTTKYTVPI